MRSRDQGRRAPAWMGLIALLAAAGVAACTSPAGPARIDNYNRPAGPAFPGLLPAPDSHVARRFIFQVHGIHTENEDWGNSLLDKIPAYGYVHRGKGPWSPARLAEPRRLIGQALPCTGNPTCTFPAFGKYKKDVFTSTTANEEIVVFTYFWRGDLWSVTGPYLQPDIQSNATKGLFPSTRKSLINAAIKGGLVDNGLSDAAGYLSGVGELEREGLESALCAMFADAIATEAARRVPPGEGCLASLYQFDNAMPDQIEFNFLSHSLGSRMLYDVLSGEDAQTKAPRAADAVGARRTIANHTRTFFMAANQLPLLAVASINVDRPGAGLAPSPPGAGVAPPVADATHPTALSLTRRAQGFFNLRAASPDARHPGAPKTELTVVAFQDPDDLLGYKASDGVTPDPAHAITFVDVVHRNTSQWLFLLASPLSAHDNELNEPHSRQMILCGARADSGGKLTANRCAGEPKR